LNLGLKSGIDIQPQEELKKASMYHNRLLIIILPMTVKPRKKPEPDPIFSSALERDQPTEPRARLGVQFVEAREAHEPD